MIKRQRLLVKDVPGCLDCPLREDGNKPFVRDELRENAAVMILGQNPGEQEANEGVPFIGQTGQAMDRDFFPQAGLTREQVSIGNALRCRYSGKNTLPEIERTVARDAVVHCSRAHLKIPGSTRLLVATGAYALYALTGHGHAKGDKISHWRGWMLPLKTELGGPATCANGQVPVLDDVYTPSVDVLGRGGPPVLATVHVAAVGYDPSLRLPAKSDWQKVKRYLKGTWPEQPPSIITEVDQGIFERGSSFDSEWIPESGRILRFSVATPSREVYVIEWNERNLRGVRRVLCETGQTMPEGSLRHLLANPEGGKSQERGTSVGSRSRDGQGEKVTLQLMQSGAWVFPREPGLVSESGSVPLRYVFQNSIADLPVLARLLPWGSLVEIEDTMLAHAVLHGGFAHSLDYLASMYSSINRTKHLDQSNPIVYSGMDAFVTLEVWNALHKELEKDKGSREVYYHHVLPLTSVILEAEAVGILIDQQEVSKGVGYLEYEMEDSTRIAQAAAGYKLNIGSSQQVGRQLYDVEEIRPPRGRR